MNPVAAMEKRDAVLLTLLAGAAAYAAHRNWDTISAKLGIGDLSPGRLKAIRLAKDAFSFAPPSPNSIVLRDRAKNGEITLPKEPWEATEIQDARYRVTCTWTEAGRRHVHVFTVDNGRSAVDYEGEEAAAPSPR